MEEIKRVKRELKFEGTILKFYQDTIQFPNGNSELWDFLGHKGAAAVVPVLPDGRIIMVRQYRNALERYTLELPAGALNEVDEPKDVCAARELEEETGYRAGKLEWLINVNTTVAFCNELIGIYLATELEKTQQHLDENEYVDVVFCELSELLDMIYTGKITDGKTVSGILAYAHKKDSYT